MTKTVQVEVDYSQCADCQRIFAEGESRVTVQWISEKTSEFKTYCEECWQKRTGKPHAPLP